MPVLAQIFNRAVRAAYTYLGVFFAFALALCLRFLLRTPGNERNLAEQLVFALYVIGHWAIVTAVILPVTFRISPALHGTIGTAGYLVIAAWASLEFHEQGLKGGLLSTLAMLLAFLAYMVVMIFVLMGFVLWEALG